MDDREYYVATASAQSELIFKTKSPNLVGAFHIALG
jgi:hypothetical protein